jgi:type IV pilus assembly protein PilA
MVVVATIGILSAIAATRFESIRARARQSEAKVNLQGIYLAEQSYYAANNTYSNDFGILGFTPERGNRYAYYLDLPATTTQLRSGPTTVALAGMDAISVDTAAFPRAAASPVEFATDGALTFAANSGGTVIPSGSVTYFLKGSAGAFLARAFGSANGNATTSDAWFISSSSATVTSPCAAANLGRVPAGSPGTTYDQSQCL